jgi:hypothetical protein
VSVSITPIFEKDPNKPLSVTFKFPIPDLTVPEYTWDYNDPIFVQGTSGTNSQIAVYPDLTDPVFPGFELRDGSTHGTAGQYVNFVSEVIRLESQIFEADQGYNYIKAITQLTDKVVGDTDRLQFIKEFRFSTDDCTWSDWEVLNIDNINAHLEYFEPIIFLQFKYDAIDIENPIFDQNILIDKPNSQGWSTIYSNGTQFLFDRDYPEFGELTYTIGYGNDGDWHLNTETGKLHNKVDGVWTSPIVWQKNVSTSGTSFSPGYLTQEIVDSALEGGFVPINDYTLSSFDIRFGIDQIDTAEFRVPELGDKIFINPLFQNISLSGVETLRINHTPRYLSPTYVPRLYLEELKFWYDLHEVQKPVACLDHPGDQLTLTPPFIIKAYSLTGFCLDATGLTDDRYLEVYFRWSNNKRHWSEWNFLTEDNLTCLKPDPLSFFYVEFLFVRGGTDETGQICICDLILEGDYDNVTDNYNKLGKYGLRSDCDYRPDSEGGNSNQPSEDGEDIPDEWKDSSDACATLPSFNPYDFNKSLALYDKLADDVNNLFAWEVDFYKTEPDVNGRDFVIHEYQVYDVVDFKKLKVIVPDNQFPDNTVLFNQFDLSLFDTFEIHITRREFHRKFGVGRRPEKRDFLFFCQVNRMYQIEHAQSYREFQNASIYYKVILKKYQDRKNIDNRNYKDPLQDLLQNNSLDNLFGDKVKEDIKKVSHKEIQENLTEKQHVPVKPHIDDDVVIEPEQTPVPVDKPTPIHLNVYANIVKEDLQNGPNIITKNWYNLSNRVAQEAVVYQRLDSDIKKGCNKAFTCWFNIQKYVPGQAYNLIDNFNTVINNGYRIDFIDGRLEILWFDQLFEIDVAIRERCWYGIVVNFNQKQEKVTLNIYTIKDNPFASSTELDLVEEHEFVMVPVEFSGDLILRLKGSNMLWSNMRLFDDIIPADKYQKVLNQYIVEDMSKLIVADNCQNRVITPHHKF